MYYYTYLEVCGSDGKESAPLWGISRFDPLVGKIPWRRKWQSTPVFLPGEFHGHMSLMATVHGVAKSQTRLSDYFLIHI